MAEWLRRGLQILARRFDSGSGLHLNDDRRAQAAAASILQTDAAAKPGDRAPHDGEAEAGAARVAIARAFNAPEWLEHRVELIGRNTRSPILDDEPDAMLVLRKAHLGVSGMLDGVLDKIVDRALQLERSCHQFEAGGAVIIHLAPHILRIVDDRHDQRGKVDQALLLRVGAAQEGQQRAHEGFHLLQVMGDGGAKLRAGDVTDFARGRLKTLLKQCEAVIDHGYGQIQTTLDFEGLAQVEAEATIRPLVAVGLEASIPTVATMKAVVNGSLIEGAKSADWWAKQSNDLAFKFAAQVRQGIAQNETMTQIVRRVAGSEKLGIPGIFEGARQNAFALVHTSVMQVASDARLATYRANSDIIKGVRQLSTMDGHTTPTCVAYSGAEWDLDGNPINGTTLPFNGGPPRHWGCRSILTSITKTFKEMGIKGLPELPDTGERASDLGPIDRKTTMDQFLKMHDTEWQDKMLGVGRADLWRRKVITLNQLLDFSGNPLTLAQLHDKFLL